MSRLMLRTDLKAVRAGNRPTGQPCRKGIFPSAAALFSEYRHQRSIWREDKGIDRRGFAGQSRSFLAMIILAALCLPSHIAHALDADGGMLDWPREEMAAALDHFIEKRMEELAVPGVAIAIVADGAIVFEKGYGVADASGDQPVTPNTMFEAGAIGFPLQAFAALQMVQEGKLAMDEPLSRALDRPWLPSRAASNAVTLRHVLTHRSGLSDRVRLGSRSVGFEPGSAYRHSGMGFVYLAHVMAEAEGKPFDRLMRERLFQPLGMSSSGYIIPEALVDAVARGHDALWVPITAFAAPMAAIFALCFVVTLLVIRLGFHRLKLKPFDLVPAAVLAPVGASIFLYYMQGGWTLIFCLGYFLVWIAGVLFLTAAIQYGRFILGQGWQDGMISRGSMRREAFSPFSFGVVVVASLFFMSWQVPLPARDGADFNAALSLRSSAHDLARFAAGFINGDLIGVSARARMVDERVEVSGPIGDRAGTGLGFYTRERMDGLTIWQPSANIGLRGLMVIEPARRSAIVVLTNSDSGKVLMQEVAGHVLGVETPWVRP